MKRYRLSWGVAIVLCMTSVAWAASAKKRIFVVSSYHREYLWSQSTQQGLSEAMLKYG